ncbi:hypothetical protein F5888DRAFT_1676862 [Russula emetica]|nr:hypothetical protein F5888DRAFT_1676862 [Russula emetica]
MSLTNAALVGFFLTSYYKLGASESFVPYRAISLKKKRPLALVHRLHTIEKLQTRDSVSRGSRIAMVHRTEPTSEQIRCR